MKTRKSSNKKNKKPAHILSDLITFDDVDDNNSNDLWFEEEDLIEKKRELPKKAAAKHVVEDEYDEITAADFVVTDEDSSQSANLIDADTKTEAFRHIIAGACMSMGLKFAGSFNQEAYETLVSSNEENK